MYKSNLKSRIIITTVSIVTLISTLFAVALLQIKLQLEEATFGSMVRDQLQVLVLEPDAQTILDGPLFKRWHFYNTENIDSLPVSLRDLDNGSYHSVRIGETYTHVVVDTWQGETVYLVYDISDWEHQEHELLEMLFYGIAIVLAAALIISNRASWLILSPVRALTTQLNAIQPNQRNIRIGNEFKDSEIGPIADAFNIFLQRLDQFVEREQSFTAAASHELRTPLSVMMGAVDILETNTQAPATGRAIDRIKRACGEMLAFIEATLFLSREGKEAINKNPSVDVTAVINDLLEVHSEMIKSAGITLNTHFNSSLIINQPKSIIQITIGNILRNAIDHSQNGQIDISLTNSTLIIKDNGEGIPEDQLPHIFDRSYTTKSDGVGVGLNLVKRICDRFNWSIDVTSQPEQGTTFKVIFSRDFVNNSV